MIMQGSVSSIVVVAAMIVVVSSIYFCMFPHLSTLFYVENLYNRMWNNKTTLVYVCLKCEI